jgi:hypothetical protein
MRVMCFSAATTAIASSALLVPPIFLAMCLCFKGPVFLSEIFQWRLLLALVVPCLDTEQATFNDPY